MTRACRIPTLFSAAPRERLLRRSLAALLFVVSFVIYVGCLSNDFVMDDYLHILSNPWIKNPRYLPEIFGSSLWSYGGSNTSLYRPLIHVLFMGAYFLFGTDPRGFHLVNLLLHAGVTVFFFLLASEMLARRAPSARVGTVAAFAASMLFATHPIHCENVAWVSGVMDIACAFFFLCSLYLYARSADTAGWRYWLSVGTFFLATLCKEPALLLVPIFACYDWACSNGRTNWRRRLPRYLPFLLVIAAYSSMRVHALGGIAPVTARVRDMTGYEYVLNGGILFSRYLAMVLVPARLNVWHVFEPATSIATGAGIGAIASVVAFGSCAWVFARRCRTAFFGQLLFLLPILPALYIPGLTQGIENAFAERYLYLPSIGFALLAGVLVNAMLPRRGWRYAIAAAVTTIVTTYSVATVRRVAVWKNGYTLWSDAVAKSPQSGTPHIGLGDAYRDEDRIDEAIEQYRIGIELMPNAASAHADLGMLYARKGWIEEGIEQLKIALSLDPDSAVARNYLGVVYGKLGRHDDAIAQLQLAIEAHPSFQIAYRHLGIAYYDAGRVRESIAPFERAIELDPDDADAHNNLGVSFAVLGSWNRAIAQFERAVELDPENPAPRANLERARQNAAPH